MTRPIHSFADKHSPLALLVLFCIVVALSLAAPRAASFAAPVAGLVMALFYTAQGQWLKPRAGDLFFALAIPALAALSALWAIDPPFALERAGKMLPMLVFGVLFIAAARDVPTGAITPRFVAVLCFIYTLITAIVGLEIFWGMKLYRFAHDIPDADPVSIVMMNRSVVVAAAFLLPVLLLLRTAAMDRRKKIILAAGVILSLLFCLFQTESQSGQIFVILSVIVGALFPVRVRAAWIITGAAVCALAVAAPFLAQYMFASLPMTPDVLSNKVMQAASIGPRLQLWDFVAREALESPLYGKGIEATRYLKSDNWMSLLYANNMLHPHNAVLQLWVEFGLIGIALGCALFVTVLTRLWRMPSPLARRAGVGVLIGMLAVMCSGYGLWQSWQIGLLLGLFALMILAFRTVPEKSL